MGCDFPMGMNGTHMVWMRGREQGSNDPSDWVEKLTRTAQGEPFGAPAPGNTIGHHSSHVLYQLTRKGPTKLDKDAMLAGSKLRDDQMAGDAPQRLRQGAQSGRPSDRRIQRRRISAARVSLRASSSPSPNLRRSRHGVVIDAA